jgi:hypothetical protein
MLTQCKIEMSDFECRIMSVQLKSITLKLNLLSVAVNQETSNSVNIDWENALPQLTLYAKNKLYKRVGPLIVGIELVKLPMSDEYRPHFVLYPLWKKDVKTSLDYPIILNEYYNKKGLQFSIPYDKHRVFFADALQAVKSQSPVSFEGMVGLNDLISAFDAHAKKPPLSAAPNSFLQAELQKAKLKLMLYASAKEAQAYFQDVSKRNWDVNHFKACGFDVNQWLQNLSEEIANREQFLKQIETNVQDRKVLQLKSSELVG